MQYNTWLNLMVMIIVIWLAVGCGSNSKAVPDAQIKDIITEEATPNADVVTDIESFNEMVKDVGNSTPGPQLVVMTYNVMCSFCVYEDHHDWVTDWNTRINWIRDVIKRHNPDLMGIQELSAFQAAYPDEVGDIGDPNVYGSVFYHHTPTDSFKFDYPDATVYYRKARFDLLDYGVFWLGPHPDKSFSGGFTGSLYRLVVWTLLHDHVTGKDFYFATTHFDNNSPNQEESAPLVLSRFEPDAAKAPVILDGDFNSAPDTTAYKILTTGVNGQGFHFSDTFDLTQTLPHVDSNVNPIPTFDTSRRIDHIFIAGGQFTVSDWVIDMWHYGDKTQTPSDHDGAVFATITLP